MKMFSVFDSKAACYDKPFVLRNKAEALRGWADVANDSKTMIGKYPADYTLFEIGSFDDLTGVITVYDAKVNLGSALEHRNNA